MEIRIIITVLFIVALLLIAYDIIRCNHEERGERKPMEFSKKLAVWAVVVATLALAMSWLLALLDKQPVTDVANTVFTACTGYLISYAAKSYGEKASRNKHGLDAEGNPINREPAAPPEKTEEPADAGSIIT